MSTGDAPSTDSSTTASAVTEAERQRSLLAALWSDDVIAVAADLPLQAGAVSIERGLQAYRVNAGANAARALEAACPTVCALVGTDDFRRLVREHWTRHAPTCGDLAEWGAELGPWLEAHPALADWPYLGDCARLDWAVHRCERAADAVLDAGSIARLGDTDPQRLHLQLRPGVAVLDSRFPVVMLHEAHRQADPTSALEAVREALLNEVGEAALVARSGWRARVHRVDAATARWTARLLAGDSLAAALGVVTDGADGADFDLAMWLATALREGWLKGIRVDFD
jgi:hypothetical protein